MMRHFCSTFIFLLLLPALVFAQSDEFIIRTLVGNDTSAPTVPGGVTVSPVSPNQIDVAWSPSTDNFGLGGYRIYRDGFHIATTSLTTFSDTGLAPSTTYSYTIDAFDVFYNVSSSSLPLATTTLPMPVIPPATTTPAQNTPAGATSVPALRSFLITPREQSATLDFTSYGPTRYIIRFGRTTAYEMGSVSTNLFKTNQQAILSNLEPGTTYYVEVSLVNGFGVQRLVRQEQFTTIAAITSSVPTSVTNLRGRSTTNTAELSWQNPDDFESIRVVRSHLFYPADIYDGVTVYKRRGSDVVDKDVFSDIDTAYYAVFAITKDGKVAAPAVLRLSRGSGSQTTKDASGGATNVLPVTPSLPDITAAPEYERYLQPSDIFLTVNDSTLTFDSLQTLPTRERVLVSIPATAVPNHLKTILVSVYDPTDNNQVTTYLLKLRGDGGAYEVSFASSNVAGEGKMMIELYDYERVVVRRISRTIIYHDGGDTERLGGRWPQTLPAQWWWSIIPFLIVLGIRRFWLVWRREDNQ